MSIAQMRGAERRAQRHAFTRLQRGVDIARRDPARNTADVEFQFAIAWPVGHRVAARRRRPEPDVGILPGGERQGIRCFRSDPYAHDVVRQFVHGNDGPFHILDWRRGGFVVAQPCHRHIALRNRAARQDEAAARFFFRQRVARVRQHFHCAFDQARFAAAAAARSAAVRIGNAILQCCFEYGLAVRNRQPGSRLPDVHRSTAHWVAPDTSGWYGTASKCPLPFRRRSQSIASNSCKVNSPPHPPGHA